MGKTNIEWCDETINPIAGCSWCSPGCDHCYAERWAERLSRNPAVQRKYEGLVDDRGRWTGRVNFDLAAFDKLPKRTPRNVFVASMGDVFHEKIPQDWIDQIWNMMSLCPQHRFLVLTKRPARMRAALDDLKRRWKSEVFGPVVDGFPVWPPANVWLGVTVCNQAEADEKIPELLATPAIGRFVSVEPMLGQICLDDLGEKNWLEPECWGDCNCDALFGFDPGCRRNGGDGHLIRKIDWVICGGETGADARRPDCRWVKDLRDQCRAAGVPFFFKQWGRKECGH